MELPNGSRKTKVTFKNAIHAPSMAFTLISISRLDKASYLVLFSKECVQFETQTPRQLRLSLIAMDYTNWLPTSQRKLRQQMQHLQKCQ